MPIGYERDDAQRRIKALGEGPFRADDVLGILERMRADGAWTYGVLYDLRRMMGRPAAHAPRGLLEAASQPGPRGELHGPTAVLALDAALYGSACAYAALGPPGLFDVFSDRLDAEAWLVAHTKYPAGA